MLTRALLQIGDVDSFRDLSGFSCLQSYMESCADKCMI